MTTTKPLTKKQKRILAGMLARGSTHSGRGGWNAAWMRALAARGLVRQGKVHTWETDWHLTDAGRSVAEEAHAEWLAEARR